MGALKPIVQQIKNGDLISARQTYAIMVFGESEGLNPKQVALIEDQIDAVKDLFTKKRTSKKRKSHENILPDQI
jgi:hypothetical protein